MFFFVVVFLRPQQEAPVDSTCLVSGWFKMSYKGGFRFPSVSSV